MRTVFRQVVTVLFLGILPAPAPASCGGAAPAMAAVHDAYLALIQEQGPKKRQAAKVILVLVGDSGGASIVQRAEKDGLLSSPERLLAVFSDAIDLAQMALLGVWMPEDTFNHGRNIDWLSQQIDMAGCGESFRASQRASINALGSGVQASPSAMRPHTQTTAERSPLLQMLLALVAVVALGLATIAIRHSWAFRKSQVERLPRRTVSTEVTVTYGSEDDPKTLQLTALDISAGGMKLRWPENELSTGTRLTVTWAHGSLVAAVIWQNTFYVGIMFDELLSEDQLRDFA